MRVQRIRVKWLIAAALVTGAVVAMCRETEADRVRQTVLLAARAFGGDPESLARTVDEVGSDPIDASFAPWAKTDSRRAWRERLSRVARARGPRFVDVGGLEVAREGNRATVTGRATISESQFGDLHAEERALSARLVRTDRWRLSSVRLGPPRAYLPEARP